MHLLLIWTPPLLAALPVETASWLNNSYELEVLEARSEPKNEAVSFITTQMMVSIQQTVTHAFDAFTNSKFVLSFPSPFGTNRSTIFARLDEMCSV